MEIKGKFLAFARAISQAFHRRRRRRQLLSSLTKIALHKFCGL